MKSLWYQHYLVRNVSATNFDKHTTIQISLLLERYFISSEFYILIVYSFKIDFSPIPVSSRNSKQLRVNLIPVYYKERIHRSFIDSFIIASAESTVTALHLINSLELSPSRETIGLSLTQEFPNI
jgi:hypothetical protein